MSDVANTLKADAKTTADAKSAPVTIKKYANRRLYNTATSSYVTLDQSSQMVKEGTDFVVYDAKSGEDITRSVLTQIIVEEEAKGGQNLLPISFLRQLIGLYGDSLGGVVPRYLELTMQSFSRNEQRMRDYMQQTLEGLFPFSPFEEMSKQNMTLFENAVKFFSPFYGPQQGDEAHGASGTSAASSSNVADIEDLQSKINSLQHQINSLTKKE